MTILLSNELSLSQAIVNYILKRSKEDPIFVSVADSQGKIILQGSSHADAMDYSLSKNKAGFLAAGAIYRNCDTIEISRARVLDDELCRFFHPLRFSEIHKSEIPLLYFTGGGVILTNDAGEIWGSVGVYSPHANEHVLHYLAELGRAWYTLTYKSR